MKHQVECPIDKIKELILQEFPNFYSMNDYSKKLAIKEFVKPIHVDELFEYMNSKDMIYYRNKLTKLLIDASKNNIVLEIRRDFDGKLAIYFADLITGESCRMKERTERMTENARNNKKA